MGFLINKYSSYFLGMYPIFLAISPKFENTQYHELLIQTMHENMQLHTIIEFLTLSKTFN